jgi:hypothetical protein
MKLKLSPKQEKQIFHLEIEQAILVPSTKRADKPVTQTEMNKRVSNVRKYLSKQFGGYTSVKGIGGYYSDDKKKLIKEKVMKVTGFAQAEDFQKKRPQVLQQLSKWSKKWGQESLGYEHEGDLYYIPSNLSNGVRKKKLKAKVRRKKK